ncbi:hypothetical protein JTE90_016621 [Oedothorax gibbosus]|uniref:Uncharacterized protein n=1 Tax=Oedothorax gibbosus TaxID=931172 RepID=A0AAV6UXU4_9ARAC|nr:hypothetical protein JTE90_016621 [Oedothorax gibbosus]
MLSLSLLIAISGVVTGLCPPQDLISPFCVCREIFSDSMMVCSNLNNADNLIGPIRSTVANGYTLFSLEISNSSLLYIPHNLFSGTGIQYIRLDNSQLMSLSDTEVAFEGLEDTLVELRATASQYVSSWDWQQLKNLKQLKLIDVHHIVMGSISEPFPPLPELTALGISDAEIEDVAYYAFADLKKLKFLVLKNNGIRHLTRNMFPYPANDLVSLDLSNNELETLPKDIFKAMPKLEIVFLDNNRFTTVSEDIFKEQFQRLQLFSLIGNDIICDCRIRWTIDIRTPHDYDGKCAEPQSLNERYLSSLGEHELYC